MSRRSWLQSTGAVAGGLAAGPPASVSQAAEGVATVPVRIRYCLNTSTISGQKLSIDKVVEIAARAGYDAIEPWIRELEQFAESGKKLSELRKQIADSGLTVDSAIGFANWIVDDPTKRAVALENMKRDMDLVRQIGGTRIAAPPAGATDQAGLNLSEAARRYHDLLELGRSMSVTPQLELWGFSKSLSRLGELMYVAIESGHPDACLLPDVYHIYKGGSSFEGLKLISGLPIHVMHMNDYPEIARDAIGDADRVYPGDGIAPIPQIVQTLLSRGFRGTFSLELFNRQYWQQDALTVAKTGLEKMKTAVETAQ